MNPISINRDGQEFGPFSPADIPSLIASGQLVATDLAWHDALPDWQPLGTLPEFAHLFQPAAAQPAAAQPQSSATARYLAQRDKTREKQKKATPRDGTGSRSKTKIVVSVLLALVFVALIAGYIVTTAIFGSAVESVLKDNATTEESFDSTQQYKVVAYDRGFLHSTADLEISFPLSPIGLPNLPVHLDIYHGPLLTGPGGTRPGSHRIIANLDPDKLPQDVAANFANETIAQLIFESDLSGNIHIEATMSGSTSQADGGDQSPSHTFSGATASFDSNSAFTSATARVEFGELTFTNPAEGSKFHSAAIVLEVDVPEIADGNIVNGTITLTVPEMTVTDPGSEIKMTTLELKSATSTRSKKFRNDLSLQLDNLTVTGDAIPLEIDGGADISFGVRGVDTDALARIRTGIAAMQSSTIEIDYASGSGESNPLQDYTNALTDMLQPGLGISASIGVSSIGGDISLDFDLAFEGDQSGRDLETLGQAINALESTGRVRLSKSFIADESFEEMIADLQDEGTVADLGDKYSITFSMRDGEARLNGQPMELPPFIQESIAEPIPWELFTSPSGLDSDEPIMILDAPGEPADPTPLPGETPDSEQPPMASDDDPGIPYDPTAPDEENQARAKENMTPDGG